MDKSTGEYVNLIPKVFEVDSRLSAADTGEVRVGSFTYDGWSTKMGAAIYGMTFHFIDSDWVLRTCLFVFSTLKSWERLRLTT